MFYFLPKKIQFEPSLVKWRVESEQSILLLLDRSKLQQLAGWETAQVALHIKQLLKKAKSLDIPIVELNTDQLNQGMTYLGEQLSQRQQVMVMGSIHSQTRTLLDYVSSVNAQICIVDDAILLNNAEQHIQWVNANTNLGKHHMNSHTLMRLWSLSAPKHLILSPKGVVFAIAEQLDLEPFEIDPNQDLRELGLDSVAMVTLIALWRANGANITFEDFSRVNTLNALILHLNLS